MNNNLDVTKFLVKSLLDEPQLKFVMDIEEARRATLREIVKHAGGHAETVRRYRLTPSQASYLSQLVTEGSKAKFGETSARNWERRLNLPQGHLVSPQLPPHAPMYKPGVAPKNPAAAVTIPVLNWDNVREWLSQEPDTFDPSLASEWISCPFTHGPLTFALIVLGDSMHDPTGRPTYSEGDIIYVDPSKQLSGSTRVIVWDKSEKRCLFRQYNEEYDGAVLKALNPAWVPRYIKVTSEMEFCGQILGKLVAG